MPQDLSPKTGAMPQDLETRKRAPLYQKKQEEEMRAVAEKAAEADIRAQEAEIKFKEAKVSPSLPPSLRFQASAYILIYICISDHEQIL